MFGGSRVSHSWSRECVRVSGERRPERRGAQALHISNGEPLKKKSMIRLVFPSCNSGGSVQEMR